MSGWTAMSWAMSAVVGYILIYDYISLSGDCPSDRSSVCRRLDSLHLSEDYRAVFCGQLHVRSCRRNCIFSANEWRSDGETMTTRCEQWLTEADGMNGRVYLWWWSVLCDKRQWIITIRIRRDWVCDKIIKDCVLWDNFHGIQLVDSEGMARHCGGNQLQTLQTRVLRGLQYIDILCGTELER